MKSRGNAEAAKNVRKGLDEWRLMQELLREKKPSAKEILEKWKSLESASSRSLCVLMQHLSFFILTDIYLAPVKALSVRIEKMLHYTSLLTTSLALMTSEEPKVKAEASTSSPKKASKKAGAYNTRLPAYCVY